MMIRNCNADLLVFFFIVIDVFIFHSLLFWVAGRVNKIHKSSKWIIIHYILKLLAQSLSLIQVHAAVNTLFFHR